MKPDQAIRLATELVKYAMTDFREPKRAWPSAEVLDARADLIKWLYRQHSSGEDYLIPLSELLQIIEYIEKRAQSQIRLSESVRSLRGTMDKETFEEEAHDDREMTARNKGTLAIISQLRAHYDRENFSKGPAVKVIETE